MEARQTQSLVKAASWWPLVAKWSGLIPGANHIHGRSLSYFLIPLLQGRGLDFHIQLWEETDIQTLASGFG
jgi:hypothetical protein